MGKSAALVRLLISRPCPQPAARRRAPPPPPASPGCQASGVGPRRDQGGERPAPQEADRPPRRAGPAVARIGLAQLDLVVRRGLVDTLHGAAVPFASSLASRSVSTSGHFSTTTSSTTRARCPS